MLLTGDAEDVGHVAANPRGGAVEADETGVDTHVGTLFPHAADVAGTHSGHQGHCQFRHREKRGFA